MFRNIGLVEIIIIAVVLLLLFGGKRIPEFIRGLGQAIKEFRSASKDDNKSDK